MNGHATTTANGHTAGYADNETHLDVLIIGAGISGVNAAYRVQTELPTSSYAVLEGRHELGGTWSQFTYPGVRSDSDLHTLGFKFNPWKARNPIATGDNILAYLQETVQKFDIEKRIRYNQKVASADWSSEQQRWQVQVDVGRGEGEKKRVVYWAKWMILGTGYYSYEKPMFAHIPGLADNFKGQTIHPQFWPEDLDFKGKKVVVIGSGATAITLLPALVDGGVGHVTQLQRSPSYIMGLPQPGNNSTPPLWQRLLPQWMVLKWKRTFRTPTPYNVLLTDTRLPIHPRPHSPLLLLHPFSPTRRLLHPWRRGKATSSRLPYRPALQTGLQPVGTASLPLPRRRLLQMLQQRACLDCNRHDSKRRRRRHRAIQRHQTRRRHHHHRYRSQPALPRRH
jgi:hypothetical protein